MTFPAPVHHLLVDLAAVDPTARKAVRALQRRAREMLAPREAPLRTGEAAEILGVDRSTLLLWARKGEIASTETTGRHRRFERTEVRRYLGVLGREVPAWLQAPSG